MVRAENEGTLMSEYEKTLHSLCSEDAFSQQERGCLESALPLLKEQWLARLSSWDRVMICRHQKRPQTSDYIRAMTDSFHELHGDRLFRDDPAVIGGMGWIEQRRCMIIGQEKGVDTKTRLERNFGMLHPEGFRKALRLCRLAEKFRMPVIFLIDTPGAYPGLAAEERGQGWAIAENLRELFSLTIPLIALIIGEGCSGGALGMGIADRVAMLEHAYYSVISPEGCASILWKDSGKKQLAAHALKMHAEDLLSFGIIDEMIPEPLGGAHLNPEVVYQNVKHYLIRTIETLEKEKELVEQRYAKFRRIGALLTHETPVESSCL